MPFVMTDSKEKTEHAKQIVSGAAQRDYFVQFQGKSEDNLILVVTESLKDTSQVTVNIVTDLVGEGVEGNADLSTNRDELNFLPFTFKGDVLANSIPSPIHKIMDRTSAGNWRKEKKNALVKWYRRVTMRRKFYAFSHACTNVVWGEDKANAAALAAGDIMSTAVLDVVYDRAKNGYTDAGGTEHPELTPYSVEEKTEHGIKVVGEYFPYFIGPKALSQLNNDPVYIEEQKAKATTTAMLSGLSGFAGVYKGLVLIEVNRDTPRRPGILRSDSADYKKYTGFEAFYKAGDDTVTEISFVLGCGAGALGFDEQPNYDEDPTEDNGRKVVAYIESFFGFEKVRWKGETPTEQTSIYHDKDYAVIAAVTTIA